MVGEATAQYMYFSKIPERIYNLLPDAKLIFILRHPVDRAYSEYWRDVRRGFVENKSFEQSV